MSIISRPELRGMRANRPSLNVVITGGTRGLGKSLSREFARQGDNVYIMSRSQQHIDDVCKDFSNMTGKMCDISDQQQLKDNIQYVVRELGTIDLWINNAGLSGGYREFNELSDETIESIISTNLLGTTLACKSVYEVMSKQSTGGAIFNLAGAGSDGTATPNFAVYGATKAAIVQLSKSLQQEWANSSVDLHIVSPGMMLTDLLMENLEQDTFDMIDFVCSEPELVAYNLVPRIKNAYYYKDMSYIRFLTMLKILKMFIASKVVGK